MIRAFFCVTKKPCLSDEEFHRYWRDVHGPLTAKIPHIRRYVQHHSVYPNPLEAIGVPSYDGVAEFCFDDYATLEKALSGPEITAAFDDRPNFTGGNTRCALLITEEHVVIEGGS